MPFTPQRSSISQEIEKYRGRVLERTGMTSFGTDSKLRALVNVFSESVFSLREETVASFLATQISSAQGADLVRIGEAMEEPIIQANHAEVFASEQSLAFYTNAASFGAINGGSPITIPAGTVVSTEPNENELGTSIEFVLTEDLFLPAGSVIAFASARCVITGSRGNLGEGTLVRHSFEDYVGAPFNSLLVTNFYKILNGQDKESDDQYRNRLSRRYNKLIASNETKLQLDALVVPGVQQARVITGFFGIGSTAVVVYGPEGLSNQNLLSSVQARLNTLKTPSALVRAIPATVNRIDFEMRVQMRENLSTREQLNLRNQIRSELNLYIRNVGIGGFIDLDDLIISLQEKVSNLIVLDTSKAQKKMFDKVYVQRGFSSSIFDNRELILGNSYSLAEDEVAELGDLEIEYTE